MPALLNAVTSNTVGSLSKVMGPTTIFIESDDLGGGTIEIYAARTLTSSEVLLGSYTDEAVLVDTIQGLHYLRASLTGSSSPSPTTVATAGTQ